MFCFYPPASLPIPVDSDRVTYQPVIAIYLAMIHYISKRKQGKMENFAKILIWVARTY